MKKEFNPKDWLTQNKNQSHLAERANFSTEKSPLGDLGVVISRIESTQTDITASYPDWRDIGFAFADEFGESGRNYFHRISQFFPQYSQTECDKQFDACLKSKGNGITLKTFFHLAKSAGINISPSNLTASEGPVSIEVSQPKSPLGDLGVNSGVNSIFNTPTLTPEIYSNLPYILKESCDMFQNATEKDVFLIGAIAVISGCLPNIEGIYFDEPNSAHLYAFVTAPAGSGKGKMKWAKFFGQTIHEQMVDDSKKQRDIYQSKLEEYHNLSKNDRQNVEKPEEPPKQMFYIPANSSSSAFIQALSDNNFRGVVFETEADTLTATFKQEWGNFSDVLRKAFHHESTSMFRRKDNEFIEIKNPHIAIALSGTPRQVHSMMPDVENGLFSRFLFYAFEDNSDFKNPFISHQPLNYSDFFKSKGSDIYSLFRQLQRLKFPISFQLTMEQGREFTTIFNSMLSRNKLLLGNDFDANIKRLGLITFRIAMVLSAMRIMEDGEISNPMICTDTDFNTAMAIATTLEKHAIAVFKNLPSNELNGTKLKFFEGLPDQFNRQDYLKVADSMGLNHKTAEKYIGQFKTNLLNHEHNQYTKT